MVSVCGYISNNITDKHDPKQADQVKTKTCVKSNLENQIDPKKITKFPTKRYQ